EQFKAKAATNRMAEAQLFSAAMPKCPIRTANWGFEQWNDWENPSYKYFKTNLFEHAGKPNEMLMLAAIGEHKLTDDSPPYRWGPTEFAVYDLGTDTNAIRWELVVTLYNDYVVSHLILQWNTVHQAKRTYYGQSLVITNWAP